MSEIYKALQDALRIRAASRVAVERAEGARRSAAYVADVAVLPAGEPAAVAAPAAAEGPNGVERRKRKRAKVTMPAGVRSADSISNAFGEVVATENASRAGLCFRTSARHYQEAMRLRVRFPYSAHHDSATAAEDCADVVRVETLDDGALRVAVAFRAASFTARPGPTASGGAPARRTAERRLHQRTELSAIASVREEKSDIALNGRCSELSLGGCYIDTLNPFAIGTRVSVQIKKDEKTFAWFGSIRSSHPGSGMGLSFEELPPQQKATLSSWLEQEAAACRS